MPQLGAIAPIGSNGSATAASWRRGAVPHHDQAHGAPDVDGRPDRGRVEQQACPVVEVAPEDGHDPVAGLDRTRARTIDLDCRTDRPCGRGRRNLDRGPVRRRSYTVAGEGDHRGDEAGDGRDQAKPGGVHTGDAPGRCDRRVNDHRWADLRSLNRCREVYEPPQPIAFATQRLCRRYS